MIVHTLESRREQWAPDLGNFLGMVQISMIYSVHATHLFNSQRQDRGGRRATLSGNYQGFAVKTADSAPPGQGTMNLHSIADVGMAGAFTETLQLTKAVTMQSCGTGTLVHEGNTNILTAVAQVPAKQAMHHAAWPPLSRPSTDVQFQAKDQGIS